MTAPRERRQSVQNMSEAQFRELVMTLFDQGTASMDEMRSLIAENTQLTKDMRDKTAAVVSILSFSETSATRVVKVARFLSGVAKILLPIVILYGAVQGMMHGRFPRWEDLL